MVVPKIWLTKDARGRKGCWYPKWYTVPKQEKAIKNLDKPRKEWKKYSRVRVLYAAGENWSMSQKLISTFSTNLDLILNEW